MPSYMMVCGFNGILGVVQILQAHQGVPFRAMPVSFVAPSVVSLLACYWGWQFIKELQAIGGGYAGDGAQDSCWVSFMGGDIWPISALSPAVETRERDRESATRSGSVVNGSRFSTFGGSG